MSPNYREEGGTQDDMDVNASKSTRFPMTSADRRQEAHQNQGGFCLTRNQSPFMTNLLIQHRISLDSNPASLVGMRLHTGPAS
jgi:hypothetical protein